VLSSCSMVNLVSVITAALAELATSLLALPLALLLPVLLESEVVAAWIVLARICCLTIWILRWRTISV
jgi:hypothetical protein